MAQRKMKVRTFSALEVANICGVVNQTAINWIKQGHLKGFTTPGGHYRVYLEDLLHFLEKRGMKIPLELQELADLNAGSILIIDDDRQLNNLLRRYLEKQFPGYTILQAFDGFEAGMLLARERPDLVLLDLDLPGINGHELCRRIKEESAWGAPVVFAITGLEGDGEKQQILLEGADAFFRKPFEFEALASEIRKVFDNE
ncbi:response regulator receiver protein [Spirochaeta thermophila DSM 6578]|uniref:Response regulator receiver protein n=1 Tax=Winmispira thermophila (strain ATCC 700085 / DSM 6578 / Z-1203) TaxID=869211 RepID=G0GEX4_WINT7|nr:response regulator [Spirochaeta thermophila]AEJ62318.1 response regulator receiver protein [Spirochaeta thermophila DSM 6578]